MGCEVCFSSITVLAKSNSFWECVMLETLEIQFELNTLNHKVGLQLSATGKPGI